MSEETEVQKEDSTPKAMYVSPTAPSLSFRLESGRQAQFKYGSFETDDPDEIAEIDKCIKTSASFSQLVRKVNIKEAEAIAQRHMAKMRDAGVQGPFTSEHMQLLSSANLEERDKYIQDLDVDANEFAAEAAEAGLVMSEEGTKLSGEAADDPDMRVPEETEGDAEKSEEPAANPMKVLGKKK